MSDQRFDAEIDDVAREMTRGGELPPDFRARVIARLESGDERAWTLRPAWLLSSLAVAAVVLVAVLVVRAPWPSGGRVAPGEVRLKPDPTYAGAPPAASPVGSDSSRITSAELTSGVPSYVASDFGPRHDVPATGSRTTARSATSDLTPAPIAIESLDVEAMDSMEAAPLSVDAMESIDVPRLDVAPLEVPVIGE